MVVTAALADNLVSIQGINGAAYVLMVAYALQVFLQLVALVRKIVLMDVPA